MQLIQTEREKRQLIQLMYKRKNALKILGIFIRIFSPSSTIFFLYLFSFSNFVNHLLSNWGRFTPINCLNYYNFNAIQLSDILNHKWYTFFKLSFDWIDSQWVEDFWIRMQKFVVWNRHISIIKNNKSPLNFV